MKYPHEVEEDDWYILFLSETVSNAMHRHKNGSFHGLDPEQGGCEKCGAPLKKHYLWLILSSRHKNIAL